MSTTELTFAKTFLSLLDTKPTKITPDHIEDPHNYPSTNPYTLPHLPSQPPLPKPSPTAQTPGTEPSISITVRSLRNPPLSITLPALPIGTTSALEIKNLVSQQSTIATDKLKLLYNKKPIADSKSLREIVGSDNTNGSVELSVMVMGGAAALGTAPGTGGTGTTEKEKAGPVATGLSGREVLGTDEFWGDLQGFLQQRLKDEGVAGEVVGVFKGAWEGR
ncbi:hypothetical protein OQA88_12203 [Cercophora sp. LCS_1]